jgi:alpha-2-macroglobulin
MKFEDMAKGDDPTRIDEQLVVTLDAQLFYTVLQALPYLTRYPYECAEQTLNRFVSTGIVSALYKDYPAIQRMAQKMSQRDTQLETWDATDPNRKMALEETPWLLEARGGGKPDADHAINMLDSRITTAERDSALAKLKKIQTSNGGFPWFPGGPPSPYMTLYIMNGLARAAEFGVPIPKEVTQRGWQYLAQHFRDEYAERMEKKDCCWAFLTFLDYTATAYPDESYTGGALTADERKRILDFSFRHWKEHSPYLKGLLALTLQRMGRHDDAIKVWDSVMDSAKTTQDEGTFWAREDRSWLWYNDSIETHAFALRTLIELLPQDARRHGLVQWILINKKLNHWKSTRATAEVIYSLVKYLQREGALGIRENAAVEIGSRRYSFVFEPDEYTGKKNQIVVPGPEIDPKTSSTITVEKTSKGFAFASATWQFSTDKLPTEDRGDFFNVSRAYFKREKAGRETTLKPLADGERLSVGDELEVQVSIRTKHEAEYVHLRDPRAAGLEPENPVSRYKWDLGISWYEETRDSGSNFFFEQLPVGQYTFKYRLRASTAGTFRIGPATIESMYAPEFNAYSAGNVLQISEAAP